MRAQAQERAADRPPVRVVLLGSGYVTVWAYRSLCRRLRRDIAQGRVQITVVAPETHHSFHGWTGEILGGVLPEGRQAGPLREVCRRARVIGGTVVGIDLSARRVRVALNGSTEYREVPYDHVVFGYGTDDDLESVPGLAEHGWSLKERGGRVAFRNRLLSALELADAVDEPLQRQRLLTTVVAGGGFAGVEMCAAVAELHAALRGRYPVLREHRPRLVLVHSGERLLPEFHPRFPRLVAYATRKLADYGVEVRLGTALVAVDAEGVKLSDGEWLPAATVLSTVGQRQITLPGTELVGRATSGRLLTDAQLRVRGYHEVWAGGDCADVAHAVTRLPCPPNALWAIKHGKLIGENIAAAVGNRPLREFTYPGLGQAASLGVGKGVLELYGRQFTGWLAWISRLLFFLRFMPSRRQAVRAVVDFVMFPLLGRYTSPVATVWSAGDGTPPRHRGRMAVPSATD
jgi:NADH dehydrogenase